MFHIVLTEVPLPNPESLLRPVARGLKSIKITSFDIEEVTCIKSPTSVLNFPERRPSKGEYGLSRRSKSFKKEFFKNFKN